MSEIANLFVISRAYAACGVTDPSGVGRSDFFGLLCPLLDSTITISDLVDIIIRYILFFAGALAVIYLLYNGILYITAGGDETKATKARQGIINAVIGIVIIVLAFVIERAAANIFTG